MTEKRIKNIHNLHWYVSLAMAAAMGFWAGLEKPYTLVLYPAVVIFIGAFAKVVIHHLYKKNQKQNDKDPKDDQKQ